MRYHPLTHTDRAAMLSKIGAGSVDALFKDVPQIAIVPLSAFALPDGQGEIEVERLKESRSMGLLRSKASYAMEIATKPLVMASEISGLEQLRGFSALVGEDVFAVLTPEGSVAARRHIGGTAPEAVRSAIARARKAL